MVVTVGLANLAFGGRPPSVLIAGGLTAGLGLGDGGHAGQAHGRQHGPKDQGACAFGHGCLLIWSTGAGVMLTATESCALAPCGAQTGIGGPPCPCGCSTPDARGKGASQS